MWCDRGGFGVGGCEAFQCAASCTRMAGLQGREVAMESAQFVGGCQVNCNTSTAMMEVSLFFLVDFSWPYYQKRSDTGNFIVPFVNHIVLFFLFAFNLFYSFTFLLFGRHALRVGSVERPARNHLRAPFSCRSMKTVSQVIPGKKVCKLWKTQNKLANEKRVFSAKWW